LAGTHPFVVAATPLLIPLQLLNRPSRPGRGYPALSVKPAIERCKGGGVLRDSNSPPLVPVAPTRLGAPSPPLDPGTDLWGPCQWWDPIPGPATTPAICVVAWHALTVPGDPEEAPQGALTMATSCSPAGSDPGRCTLFVQRHVHEHAALAWLLECTASRSELRPHDRVQGRRILGRGCEEAALLLGFFAYPVLHGRDILPRTTRTSSRSAPRPGTSTVGLTREVCSPALEHPDTGRPSPSRRLSYSPRGGRRSPNHGPEDPSTRWSKSSGSRRRGPASLLLVRPRSHRAKGKSARGHL